MRILNVGQNYRIVGGAERYQLSLESLLESCGVEVVPFAASHPENLESNWSNYFPRAVDFQRPRAVDLMRYVYSPDARQKMTRLLSENTVDLAHLHIYYGQLTGSILSPLRRAQVPVVQTLHEYKLICPTYKLFANNGVCEDCRLGGFKQAVVRRCNRGSLARSALSAVEAYVTRALGSIDSVDHFIAVSSFLREKVIEHGVPADRVTTVHNFMDASCVRPAEGAGSYFLFFGRLERVKGIYSLLDAVAGLKGVQLLIAGDGEEKSGVEARCEAAPFGNIRYVGFKSGEALHELIRGARAVVAPSEWYETFGLTLLEGLAHARPVISSRIGGMTEVVEEGVDGLLVAPGDVEGIRKALLCLWNDEAKAVSMGVAGRRKVLDKFGPERHIEGIRSVYAKVGVSLP